MKQKIKYLFLLCSITLSADQFSFIFYNDVFAKTDKHFTNGMSLSWIDDTFGSIEETKTTSYNNFIHSIVNTLPFTIMDCSKHHNAGISLSQYIFTPADKSIATPQYNDIPYAGYLALSFYLFEWDNKSFHEFRIEFGVVGKESGAEFVQKKFHSMIGNSKPKGWNTQIGTQYTANALFRYGEKSWEHHNQNGLTMDWFNHFGIQAGNFLTDAFGGTIFRIGHNYNRNFNLHYPYLKEEASLLRLDKKHHGLGWSLSTGINGELLAYSYILDEAKKEGYTTEKKTINFSIYAGADLYYEAHKLTFLYQSQSSYTNQQNTMDSFGGIIYSFQF